jgi:membrane protein implicated in regulation of membrane protease activity
MRVFLARTVAFLVAILLWVFFVCKLIVDWLGRTTALDDFNQLMERLPVIAGWLLATPWWVPGGLASALTAFLIWAGWPTDRPVSRRSVRQDPYRDLGVRAMQVAQAIEHFQSIGKFVGNGGTLGAEVYAAMVRFHDAGFDVPEPNASWDQDRRLNSAFHYLSTMGVLLRDGSFAEARLLAAEMSSDSAQAKFTGSDRL